MKLLFCMEHLYPLVGGAEHSTDTLLRAIEREPDIDVEYVCASNMSEKGEPRTLIEAADIVITQLNWSKAAIEGARRCNKKSIQFVRSLEGFCAISMDCFAVSHCGQRCASCFYRLRGEELKEPDLLIANSRFTQRLLKEEYGLSSEVIYPFINREQVIAPRRAPKYITMNQLAYHKGGDIFLKLAEAFPELPFRAVGSVGWMPSADIPANVELAGPLPTAKIYEEALVFVAPARISETFGRCVVEAQLNGVPVIASNRGGPKYDSLVLERYRIDEIDDVDRWVEQLRWILANYEEACADVRQQDFSFCTLDRNVAKFLKLLRGLHSSESSVSNQTSSTSHISFS